MALEVCRSEEACKWRLVARRYRWDRMYMSALVAQ